MVQAASDDRINLFLNLEVLGWEVTMRNALGMSPLRAGCRNGKNLTHSRKACPSLHLQKAKQRP